MSNPYMLPDGNVLIAFSGGRTSAYMLHQILEANGCLPNRVKVSFQNTGREMPETLDFVAECAQRWGVDVVWLEYRALKPFFEIVGHSSASRDGEPFEQLIRKRKYLPNQQSRFCTQELKVRTSKRYLLTLEWKKWVNAVGIRADEPKRLGKPTPKERWTVWTPLADAKVSRHDVATFWRRQSFDLALPNIGGNCWVGNCDGCFLKSEASLGSLQREYPSNALWWEKMESLAASLTSGTGATWSKRYSRKELRRFMEGQGDLIEVLSANGVLCQAEGGECAPY